MQSNAARWSPCPPGPNEQLQVATAGRVRQVQARILLNGNVGGSHLSLCLVLNPGNVPVIILHERSLGCGSCQGAELSASFHAGFSWSRGLVEPSRTLACVDVVLYDLRFDNSLNGVIIYLY